MYRLTEEKCRAVIDTLAKMLLAYCMKNRLHYLVLGESGGLDSAVVSGIASLACEMANQEGYALYTVAVILPCDSDLLDELLALKVIEKFNLKKMKVDLTENFHNIMFNGYPFVPRMLGFIADINKQVERILTEDKEYDHDLWEDSRKIAQGNVKARLRMIALRHIARMLKGGMVLSTDNLSEYWMGFWTLDGDVGDYAPIQKIMKGVELYDIAACLGVPQEIIDRAPTDGLGVNKGGDAAQIGAEYPAVDAIMIRLIQKGFDVMSNSANDALLTNMPAIPEADFDAALKVAVRANNSAFKRLGTIIVERDEIGLPDIKGINLD